MFAKLRRRRSRAREGHSETVSPSDPKFDPSDPTPREGKMGSACRRHASTSPE